MASSSEIQNGPGGVLADRTDHLNNSLPGGTLMIATTSGSQEHKGKT